jgi:hypothetical protein
VQYHVHDGNSSGSATGIVSLERQLKLLQPIAKGLEQLRSEFTFSASEMSALKRRLHREYFWHLGYSAYRQHGYYRQALASYYRGLREWPWSARAWKTCATTTVQGVISGLQ